MQRFENEVEERAFRSQVMHAAAQAALPADAPAAWRGLLDGESSVVDAFTTTSCSYLVTTRALPHAPVPRRGVIMLERVLTGSYPKRLAADLNLSTSTVATALKDSLDRLGAACLPSKVPFGLAALACAACSEGVCPKVYVSGARLLGFDCEILTTAVPSLTHLLSPTVEEVLRMHVAGRTHREIAALRGTSCRTIANQLGVAFRRLGGSGRLSVLEVLLSLCHEQPPYGLPA